MIKLDRILYFIFIFFFLVNAFALSLSQSDTLAPMSESVKGKSGIITLSFLKTANKHSPDFETSFFIVKITLDNQVKSEEKQVEINGEKKIFKVVEYDKNHKVFEELNTAGFYIDFAEVGKTVKRTVGDLYVKESYEATLRGWPALKNKSVKKITEDLMQLGELGEKDHKIIYAFLEKGLSEKIKAETLLHLAREIVWKEKLESGKISLPSGRTIKSEQAARILVWIEQLNLNDWKEEDSAFLSERFHSMTLKNVKEILNLINQKGIEYEFVQQYLGEKAGKYLEKFEEIENLALKNTGFSRFLNELQINLLRIIRSSS